MLHLRLFSRLQILDAASAVTPRLSPRAQRLLACLLLRRAGPVPRESLAFTLWPDQPEADALGALRRALNDLRTGLPAGQDWVLATRDELRWNPAAPVWLDLDLYERWLAHGVLATQHDAVALYTGDLLRDWDEDWILGERERLRQRQAAALRQLVAHHRGLADYEAALTFARQAVALDPLAEAGYRDLMALRYAAGDRAAALAEYERLRALLQSELGVDPMPDTQALAAAISQGQPLLGDSSIVDSQQPSPMTPLLPADAFGFRRWERGPGGEEPPVGSTNRLPPLIGRDTDLSRLSALWESAAAGHGRFAIVGGPAGVGKTHLTAHLAAYAAQRGGLVLTGHCYEFERALPYQALAEMLRAVPGLLRAADLPAAHRHSLARLLPEVLDAAPPEAEPGQGPSTDEVRAQLYEALLQACLALARAQPLLLVFEDAHWAAESTLDWLTYAAPRLGHSRLLTAITYRTGEVPGAELALARLGRRFAREGTVTTLTLFPLSREAHHALVAQLSGLAPAACAPLADRLYHESAGNPFFLNELVRGLLESGALAVEQGHWAGGLVEALPELAALAPLPMPDTLRDTLTARVDRLTPPAQQWVRAAAVAGRVFVFDVLRHAADWPEDDSLTALEELLARGFIAASAGPAAGEYVFAHHLVQEVLYADLAQPRRVYWHRRLGQALQALRPDDFESLAHHFHHAGEAAQARAYYRQAGDRAARLAALEEAAAHYAAALATWPADEDPAGRAATLFRQAECLWVTGESIPAFEAFQAARTIYEALGDVPRTSEVLRLMGRVTWENQDRANALRYYHQALAILGDLPESVALARAVSALSQMHMLGAEFDQAMAWGQRALALADRLGAEDVRLHALNNLGAASAHLPGQDVEVSLGYLRESLQRALALNLPHDASRAYLNLSENLRGLGRFEEARASFAALRAYATRMHTRKFADAGLARGADLDWQAGRLADVLARLPELQAVHTGPPGVWVIATLAQIEIDLGRPAAARDRLENSLDRILRSGEIQSIVPHLGQLLRACAALDDAPAATDIALRIGYHLDPAPYFDWGCILPALLACRWLFAHPHLAPGDALEAALARLERAQSQLSTPETVAAYAEAQGFASLTTGQPVAAIPFLQQAVNGWAALGAPLDQLRATLSLAQAYDAASRPALAHATRDLARTLTASLAPHLPDPTLRQSFLTATLGNELGD